MVEKLASPKYMNTKTGTGVNSLASGIEKYLKEKGIKKYRIDYEGWRSIGKTTKRISTVPSLATARDVLSENSAVFLNIGRYKKRGGNYLRHGGHWLTVVGAADTSLEVFDPAGRNGSAKNLQDWFHERGC